MHTEEEAVQLHQDIIRRNEALWRQLHRKELAFDDWNREVVALGAEVRAAPLFEGLETLAPRGGMTVVVTAFYPTVERPTEVLLTQGGYALSDRWCTCGGQHTFYWEYLVSGSHGWACVRCSGITQVG